MSQNPAVVVDSGVFLASLFPSETLISEATQLLAYIKENGWIINAPKLLRYELVAAIRKNVYRRRIEPDDADWILKQSLNHRIRLLFSRSLLQRAYALATEYDLPTAYDSQYLAVAEHLNCTFWTADEKLFNNVRHKLPWVKWIGAGLPS